jgi:chromosome segregation ATPase
MAAALAARNGEVEASIAQTQQQLAALDEHLVQRDSAIAELTARNAALIAQLNDEQARAARLQQSSDQRATEIAIMHQRINALEMELLPLRVKGARYDRVAGWLPLPVRAAMRDLLRWRRRLRSTEVRP